MVRDNHVTSRRGEHAHLHEQAVGLDAVFVVCRLEDDVDDDDDAVLYLHHVTDTDQYVCVCVRMSKAHGNDLATRSFDGSAKMTELRCKGSKKKRHSVRGET